MEATTIAVIAGLIFGLFCMYKMQFFQLMKDMVTGTGQHAPGPDFFASKLFASSEAAVNAVKALYEIRKAAYSMKAHAYMPVPKFSAGSAAGGNAVVGDSGAPETIERQNVAVPLPRGEKVLPVAGKMHISPEVIEPMLNEMRAIRDKIIANNERCKREL